eukprot:6192410-Pleurochrysis_carterae.AAC.1
MVSVRARTGVGDEDGMRACFAMHVSGLMQLLTNQSGCSRPCLRPLRLRPTPYSAVEFGNGAIRGGESSSIDRVR